jgi:hypothetical protein
MKKQLLIWVACLLPLCAAAQFPFVPTAGLVLNGAQAGAKALKNRGNKPGEFVTYFHVGTDSVAQKRTPENKLRGDASINIRQLEAYLTRVYVLYQQPQVESICPDAQNGAAMIRTVRQLQQKWDVVPYEQELAFYQQQHQRRYTAARQREQQEREAYDRRQQTRRDSLTRIAIRRQQQTDSVSAIARAYATREQARVDSVSEIARRARAEELNRALLTPAGRQALARGAATTTTHTTAAKPQPHAKATGAVVYMCDSGNSVKYHASPTCRGLNRCGATIVKISKAEATQTMDPCKFCY